MKKFSPKVTHIVVPVNVLPGYVSVETCRITPQYAKEKSVENVSKISKQIANILEGKIMDSKESTPPTDKPQMVELCTMPTDYFEPDQFTVPCRSLELQTQLKITSDVGIQCQLDDPDNQWCSKLPTDPQPKKTDSESKFLEYVNQHTKIFPNEMLECRQCGEVSKLLSKHKSHMRLHYGPPAFCLRCGKRVSHQHFLAQHNYRCPQNPRSRFRPQMHLQCPHLHCNFMITSKKQLRRHLQNHLSVRAYHCLQCRKLFSSSTELLAHRMLHLECHRAKYIYLTSITSQSSRGKPQFHRCTVCMLRFSNWRRCDRHNRECNLRFQRRVKQLLKRNCTDKNN